MLSNELVPLIRWLHFSGAYVSPKLARLPAWSNRFLALWSIISFTLIQFFFITSCISLFHWIQHPDEAKKLKISIFPIIVDIIRQLSVSVRIVGLPAYGVKLECLLKTIDGSMNKFPNIPIKSVNCKIS